MRPILSIAFLAAAATLSATSPQWRSDLAQAQQEATKSKKPVMLLFTGSEWCPYCILLEKEVFRTEAFAAWAEKAILLKLDYPVRKERTPEKLAANKALAELITLKDKHKIEGFPTVLWLSPEGTELARVVSYTKGTGPKTYLAQFPWPK